jgi:ParB/RepB/Spo0J family partition protein
MIQPLTVVRSGDGYLLITGNTGERRLLAARFLGLATVPVRVLPTIERREDVLSLQLIENLQREDLNPIDMAEGLHAFIHARQGDVSLDEIMNAFILYERSPERFSGDFAGTVPTIV